MCPWHVECGQSRCEEMLRDEGTFRRSASWRTGSYSPVDLINSRVMSPAAQAEFGGHSYISHSPGSLFLTLPTLGSTGYRRRRAASYGVRPKGDSSCYSSALLVVVCLNGISREYKRGGQRWPPPVPVFEGRHW
jgi:hypothetical protein